MSKPFVHIHNHTEYSLLDGAQKIEPMVLRAKELGMPALAISDHGAMFGVMEFYLACKKHGVKPIIGMEAYVAPEGLRKKDGREENSTYHLLLLAKNRAGYLNLCKLATIASLEGFYHRPRIDHHALREHADGLIGTTTCLSSEVCRYLLEGDYDRAQRTAAMYKEIFGEGNYFVELQDHRLPEQARIRDDLLRIAKELKLPVVCTNDAHYLCRGDAEAHDVLLCIQTNSRVADKERMRFATDEFYLKSPDEMAELFRETPEAIENTLAIADMVHVELESERAELPDPEIPAGKAPDEYLRELAEKGLKDRFDTPDEQQTERLDYELNVIRQTGFSKYFLVVREIAQFARQRGIYFGVRGSAAGSLASFCLGVTDVDPLEYGLTFERFLNPERREMPDIDMDFEDARRDEVIRYVRERFGREHVAQIITFGTLAAKAAMRDAGRALGISPVDVDRLCKLVPGLPGATIQGALEEMPDFRRAYDQDPSATRLIDTAKKIEGTAKHYGVHAAGIVISKQPLGELVPLARGADDQILTQYPMDVLEKIGLLKMDLLGLSNLTVLARAVANIAAAGKGEIDVHNLPPDDARTYEMIGRGETVGVFQLEGSGMTRYVTELKPQNLDELAAMIALYRPGPMEHIVRYIRAKFGLEQPRYPDPRMEPILRESYGVIVFQDQVLQLVRALAGFTLGEADVLRKAMGKKDRKAMEDSRQKFIAGAVSNGMPEQTAADVFELLRPFAGYAFNKAHAVCYAMIAYQTAYLKANYPVEFMSALLGAYQDKEDRVVGCIEDCRRMGIEVLPPDINRSSVDFTIEADRETSKIRFGLGAIKGIGDAAIQGVLKAREEGPFTHLYELAERARAHGGLNRSSLEALIKAGALDSIEPNRSTLLSVLDTTIAWAERSARDKLAGQESLFVSEGPAEAQRRYPLLPEAPMPTRRELLTMEKEVVGLYLSDHPLRGYESALAAATHSAGEVADLDDGTTVKLAGVVAALRQVRTKSKNELMASFLLEDLSGQVTVTVFPSTYAATQSVLAKDRVVAVHGQVQHREQRSEGGARKLVEVIARRIESLSEGGPTEEGSAAGNPGSGVVNVKLLRASLPQLRSAQNLIRSNPGEFEVLLEVDNNGTPKSYRLTQTVSDGPWLHELRLSLAHGFVLVRRSGPPSNVR